MKVSLTRLNDGRRLIVLPDNASPDDAGRLRAIWADERIAKRLLETAEGVYVEIDVPETLDRYRPSAFRRRKS